MKKLTISMASYEKILGWVYYAIQILILPQLIVSALSVFGIVPSDSELNLLYFLSNFIAMVAIFHQFLLESFRIAKAKIGRCFGTAGLGFLIYWGMSITVMAVILYISPDYANLNNENIGAMQEEHQILISLAAVLLVPVAEELVFRGLIFRSLFNYSNILAYTVSTLAFSLVHVIGYMGQMDLTHALLSILQYLPAGIALGWTYQKTDTIWTPVLMHTFINLIGIFAVG